MRGRGCGRWPQFRDQPQDVGEQGSRNGNLRHLDRERNASPHTVRAYGEDLAQFARHVRAELGRDGHPRDVDHLLIRAFLARLHRQGLKSVSAARKLATLRTFFRYLCREGVLDRNPANHFAEVEQAGFAPGNLVPGIGLSPDKMLMGRVFSYHDAHLHRIGTNYEQLPVNAPRCPVHSYSKDGHMTYGHAGSQPIYAPNSYGGPKADPSKELPTWLVEAGEVGLGERSSD